MELSSLNKFGTECESRSRSANDSGAKEKVIWCKVIECLLKSSLNLVEIELNAVGRHTLAMFNEA